MPPKLAQRKGCTLCRGSLFDIVDERQGLVVLAFHIVEDLGHHFHWRNLEAKRRS